jgi:hypothetical protein
MKTVKRYKDAELLLSEIRKRISACGLLFMNHRRSNAQTLADLDITVADQRKIIDHLTVADYCSGPEADERYPWKYIALFGKEYKGVELYIKLSVGLEDTAVVCISFHEAAYPMIYQFK